jgi:hypothetical protein
MRNVWLDIVVPSVIVSLLIGFVAVVIASANS